MQDRFPSHQSLSALVLDRHAARDFGTTGYREVRMEVFNGAAVAFSYLVHHLWQRSDDNCASLYYLMEPHAMLGTAVLAIERQHTSTMDIWLRLRTAKRPVKVHSSRSGQCFLGTDFTYEDLRFWLPMESIDIKRSATVDNHGTQSYVLEGTKRLASGLTAVKVVLHGCSYIPIAIDTYAADRTSPVRTYRAADLTQIDGIWTPRLITVVRPKEGYRSTMSLVRLKHHIRIESNLLRAEALTSISPDRLGARFT